MLPNRFFRLKSLLMVLVLAFSAGLSGCVYFNTFYNAQKAYDKAMAMRDKRLDKNPNDSVLATAEEKLKFERCITKCSKVLELYPEKKQWQSRAVFLMAEAYYQQGEWTRAIAKFDEFLRYFPDEPQRPTAEVHRAIALYHNGQYPAAHSALTRMLALPLDDELRTEALFCLAKMEGVSGNDSTALAAYERLLKDAAKSSFSRAQAHAAAAELAFGLKRWASVREHALAPEIKLLPVSQRIRMALLAADAQYALGRHTDGISELEITSRQKVYRDSLAPFHLKMAEGHLVLKRHDIAFPLIGKVARAAPRTRWSAEGWFRRGEYELRVLFDEVAAKLSFDSSAAQGSDFEYAKLARERSEALTKLADYRKKKQGQPSVESRWRDEFMISELFVFNLDQIDSALVRLDSIADAPNPDSVFALRAAYARAYIQDEYKQNQSKADSLYRLILQRHPATVFAQQAERNLGLKPTVQTPEDSAHTTFLEAEKLRFSGGDLTSQVVPAYTQVVERYPHSQAAAKAQFVIAMLYEGSVEGQESARNLDSAKVAHGRIRDDYPKSPFAPLAQAKLLSAGITAKPTVTPGAANPPTIPGQSPSQPTTQPKTQPETSEVENHGRHGRPSPGDSQPPPQPSAQPQTQPDTSSPPDGKTKEVLEPDYDDVDQY
jgi:outer membrane protein assembly factor BamD (BamD/ComL family)